MKKVLAVAVIAVSVLPGCAAYQAQVAQSIASRTDQDLCAAYAMPGGSINHGPIRMEFEKRKSFTAEEWQAIERKSVFIGMKENAVTCAWGTPRRVNRTITSAGRSEQWVYGRGSYVYIRNGFVEAVQS